MVAPDQPLVPVIVGPTAVGKTAVALALNHLIPIAVISADSRQIYRNLNIGTAKPSPEELALVPHYGIDLLDPGERYSAGRFGRDAIVWLEQIGRDRLPVVVGGTGFYVRVLAEGLFREPPLSRTGRERIRAWSVGETHIARWARRLDPRFTGGGRQRASRVVEIALLTGRPLSWWQRRAQADAALRPWVVRLTVPRSVLRQRIADRTKVMLDRGLVDEVGTLLAAGVSPQAPGLDTVGYREVVRYLEGSLDQEALGSLIETATRQYAKRQETWFRHQLGREVLTLDAVETPERLAETIYSCWKRRGN